MKTVYLKLTNGCNLHCKHCYNEQMKNHSRMDSDTLKRSIKFLLKLKEQYKDEEIIVQLHGGEPLLYKLSSISFLVDLLHSYDFKVGCTTNLVYELKKEHLEIFNKLSKVEDRPFLQTSWDYKIRFENKEQEDLWLGNVAFLLSAGIDVQPTICLTSLLLEEMNPYALLGKFMLLGCNKLNFERITNNGSAVENKLKPSNTDVDAWLLEAYKVNKQYFGFKIPLFNIVEQSIQGNLYGCRARHCTKDVITINPDGTVSSCPNIAHQSYTSIKEKEYQPSIHWIHEEQVKHCQCYQCEYYAYCNGDCFQLNWDTTCPGLKSLYAYLLNAS